MPEKTRKKHKNLEKIQIIYGLHSVKAALENEKREHDELLINENHSNLAKKYQSKIKKKYSLQIIYLNFNVFF